VLDVVRDSRFADCPLVLESVFPSVAEAAEYRAWFESARLQPTTRCGGEKHLDI